MKRSLSRTIAAGLVLTAFAQAGPITTGLTRIDNAYPEKIAFEIDASSTAASITRVELHLTVRGDTSTSVFAATFDPGARTTAQAEWKTRQDGIPPGTRFIYQWRVWDEAGNTLTTTQEEGLVLDPRRTWSELTDERVAVWWYEGDAAFGKGVFDVATASLREMERESGLQIPFRLHVVLYPDPDAFAEWHEYVLEWVAGEAYPPAGLTVQIVSPSDSRSWIQMVICHEVAHLFFYQATNNALYMGPASWISEGYAQYHECLSDDWQAREVQAALSRGDLIPLRLATGSFSGDDARVSLLYAESWSAVDFLYDRWGDEGMADLLAAFREGADSSDALRAATGLDSEQYQEAWWEWLGGAPGAYPTPPSMVVAGTAPVSVPAASPSPTVEQASAIASPGEATPPLGDGGAAWPCTGGAAALLLGMAANLSAWYASRRTRQSANW